MADFVRGYTSRGATVVFTGIWVVLVLIIGIVLHAVGGCIAAVWE